MRGRTDRLPRCGAWMPNNRERCARASGHRWEHRSRYSMDNQSRWHTGRDPDPYVFRDGQWVPR